MIINQKTMAAIILGPVIFLALTSAAIQAEKIAFVRENNIWLHCCPVEITYDSK
jgi:hypothetical protein